MLIINRAENSTIEARCFVTNMSRDFVHIHTVVAKIATVDGDHTAYITEAEDIRSAGNPTGWQHLTRQGPLAPGSMADMGTFACIVEYALNSDQKGGNLPISSLTGLRRIEITILGVYGTEDLLIGASREFECKQKGNEVEILPVEMHTKQITSRRQRKALAARLLENL